MRAKRLDIADIVKTHRAQLEQQTRLSAQQRRTLTDIAQCRTELLGGRRDICPSCGFERYVYLSCRNRHCPKCQALAQEKWISSTKREIAARLLHQPVPVPCPSIRWQLQLSLVTGEDPQLCPRCGSRLLAIARPAVRRSRAPPRNVQPRSAA